MAIVRSFGIISRPRADDPPPIHLRSGGSTALGGYSYAEIYRAQPEVRVVVEFLARNIAQLGIHLFQAFPDGDRHRDRDHPCAVLLNRPNPAWTRYRLFETTVHDLAIYAHAFWLKMRKGTEVEALMPVPPDRMSVAGDLYPQSYRYEDPNSGRVADFPITEVIHFRGYDPTDPLRGLPALESLKGIIAESRVASEARIQFWKSGARLGGVIERPRESGKWSTDARERFRAQFTEKFAGPNNVGNIPVLDEGMTFRPVVSTMKDAEAISAWKLSREEVARAYHIPLPMVGILDHATFSNIKEQHRHLYQDCLGPWLAMLSEDLELQLLNEWPADAASRYLEFNIAEKLSGSFEEQTAAYQTAVGRPWMTVDEVRARQNLPRLGGNADRVVMPLNLSVGDDIQEAAQ